MAVFFKHNRIFFGVGNLFFKDIKVGIWGTFQTTKHMKNMKVGVVFEGIIGEDNDSNRPR